MSIEVFNIDEEIFTYKEMIGKDRIFNPQFSFYTEFFNDKLFHVAQDIITKKQKEPIPIFADILVLKNNASKKQIGYLKKLYTSKNNNQERTVCLLKSELITRFPKRKFIEENSNNNIIFQFISNHKDFSIYLLKVIEDWQIKLEEQVQFLNFLLANTEHYNYYHISDFYTHIFKAQTNTKKDKDLNFRLGYINYLKKTKQYYIAIPIYEELIYQVEEDNLLDIISDSKINIIDGEHSNQLRIQLLEDLAKIKTELKTSNDDELLKLAILQPLTTIRIDNLKTATKTVLKQKAEVVCSTMSIASFNCEDKIPTKLSPETYEKENLFELVVPECFKKKQGFLQTLTNLIAQIDPPDYSNVLQFSEKVTESNQPRLYRILKETSKILSITSIECFLGRGNYSSEIIGVEGATNFLIVGCDYLDEKNIKYLSYKELQFLISIELSHILFEHTRLTSKDIWRGAKNKSLNLAQVLLIALPVLGTLGNVIGKYANISYLGKMINGIDRINNVVEKGQTAIEYSGKVRTIISKKEEKEKNLLATSRLMEISADRAGLLITKDIKSCLTAILKSDSDFEQTKEFIEKKGVLTFLKQQNEELEYLNQSYIIRLKMLFNFYLTNDII